MSHTIPYRFAHCWLGGAGWASFNALLQQAGHRRATVLTDANTRQHCLPHLQDKLSYAGAWHTLELPTDEAHKTLASCTHIWDKLLEVGTTRQDALVILGGGVLLDLGGFAAATFKRGIPCYYVPTTLLAQVDAAIGGKTGVNYNGWKNQIGVFAHPRAILADPAFLQTLSAQQIRNGAAELIKHALIGDVGLWKALQSVEDFAALPSKQWERLIRKGIRIKVELVEADPYDHGPRQLLNFGHTIGHALERCLLKKGMDILHGEAVVAGMVMESFIAQQKGKLPEDGLREISVFLTRHYPALSVADIRQEALWEAMRHDKKRADSLLASLPEAPGKGLIRQPLLQSEVEAACTYYHQVYR